MVNQYFRLVRAKEEIVRLNVEMRRMRTWIRDDEAKMKSTLERLRLEDVNLAYEVQIRLRARSIAHLRIEKHFKEVEGYIGFTGLKTYGVRYDPAVPLVVVDPPPIPQATPPPEPSPDNDASESEDGSESEGSLNEAEQEQIDLMDTALARQAD